MLALGEKNFGGGNPDRNMVGVSQGTSFGVGIITNNMLYSKTYLEQEKWQIFLIWIKGWKIIAAENFLKCSMK